MKGYIVDSGYYGWLNGKYILFATEQDYIEVYNALYSLETN